MCMRRVARSFVFPLKNTKTGGVDCCFEPCTRRTTRPTRGRGCTPAPWKRMAFVGARRAQGGSTRAVWAASALSSTAAILVYAANSGLAYVETLLAKRYEYECNIGPDCERSECSFFNWAICYMATAEAPQM